MCYILNIVYRSMTSYNFVRCYLIFFILIITVYLFQLLVE
nr:MAG TPA: hypothetical protein [Bacteriophage sp.]